MSISSAISAARSGLQTTGLRADIVATNVANASTPGYVRRSIMLGESLAGGQTVGVHSDGIARSGDEALTSQRRALTSNLTQANILASTWRSISTRVGDSVDGSTLFQQVSSFETALSNAALSPESSAQVSALLDSAKSVVNEFNSLSDMVVSLRAEADREIKNGVDTVNDALKKVETLNGRISASKPNSSEAAALIDERQRVLDTIAEYLPIQTVERTGGAVDVLTKEGVFLVAGRAREVTFDPSFNFSPSATLGSGELSGISVDGTDITPGATTFGAISSGMLSSLFQLRDQDLPTFSDQLDTLAGDLVARLSDDSIDPSKTPGDPGLFVDSSSAGGPGLAGRLSINAAVDPAQGGETWRLRDGLGAATPGQSGNASTLNGMLAAITSVKSINANGIQGNFTSAEMAAHFSSLVGQSRINHESVLSSVSTQHSLLVQAEQTETGVDVDAQMQDLLLIEQAYAANARVIEVATQMLNRLMEL